MDENTEESRKSIRIIELENMPTDEIIFISPPENGKWFLTIEGLATYVLENNKVFITKIKKVPGP